MIKNDEYLALNQRGILKSYNPARGVGTIMRKHDDSLFHFTLPRLPDDVTVRSMVLFNIACFQGPSSLCYQAVDIRSVSTHAVKCDNLIKQLKSLTLSADGESNSDKCVDSSPDHENSAFAVSLKTPTRNFSRQSSYRVETDEQCRNEKRSPSSKNKDFFRFKTYFNFSQSSKENSKTSGNVLICAESNKKSIKVDKNNLIFKNALASVRSSEKRNICKDKEMIICNIPHAVSLRCATYETQRHPSSRMNNFKLGRNSRGNRLRKSTPHDIFAAVTKNSVEDLRDILKESPSSANVRDAWGRNALHYAARNGLLDIGYELLSYNSSARLSDHEGRTPLHEAVDSNQYEFCRLLLLCSDANPCAADFIGITPLHLAAQKYDAEFLEMLLPKASDVNVKDAESKTPLWKAVYYGCLECVKRLLDYGAEFLDPSHTKYTLLYTAISREFMEIFLWLVSAGAKLCNESWVIDGNYPINLKSQKHAIEWIRNHSKPRPYSLLKICVYKLRKSLQRDIENKINKLNLPVFALEYALLKDLHSR